MNIVEINKIYVDENRQRKTFDDNKISELAQSIESPKGLLHPIVVREKEDGRYALVAGERRLRAIQSIQLLHNTFVCGRELIQPGFIPVTLINELSPLELEEAELEENILRVDLTLQEQAQAVARLFELRKAQNGNQTIKATAEEIYGDSYTEASRTTVGEHLIIAKHLDDPDVAKAKTRKEALKIIEKKANQAHRAELAKTFDTSKTSHELIFGSAFEALPKLPQGKYSCILTDPPYGVEADRFGGQAKQGHNYKDDLEYAAQCYHLVAVEGYRITKPQASAYVFCDIVNFALWKEIFTDAGWIVWYRPLIWNKKNGMLPAPDYGPRNTYEAILYAYKENTKLVKLGQPDVLTYGRESEIQHGAQKPPELYLDLLSRSTNPGDYVIDMFAGSGTIFPASNSANVYATGIELVQDNYNLALTRMDKRVSDGLDIFDTTPPAPF